MLVQAVELLRLSRQTTVDFTDKYGDLLEVIAAARLSPGSTGLSDEELVDIIRVLRDVVDIFDRLRKEAKSFCEDLEDGLVRRSSERLVNDAETDGLIISTPYAKATVDIKAQMPVFSKTRDPENYARVMKWLGVPDYLIAAGALQTHWEGMKTVMEDKLARGEPLPEGLDPNKVYYKGYLRLWRRADPLKSESPVTENGEIE